MQNILKKYLGSNKQVFDIVLYGSGMKGKAKPEDIDLLMIFNEGNLKERLEHVQNLRQMLQHETEKKTDIKECLLTDFFSPGFFARTGIFLEGKSTRTGKHFSENLGFWPQTLFWYSLENLSHTEKVKFNYVLAGRNMPGIIKELKGERISKGVIRIPIERSLEFEEILKNNRINYNKSNILVEK